MPGLSFSDSVHNFTCDAVLTINHMTTAMYHTTVLELNSAANIATVTLADATTTITLKDSRVFAVTSQAGAQGKETAFQVSTQSFFTVKEYGLLQALASLITQMSNNFSLTTLTDTFA